MKATHVKQFIQTLTNVIIQLWMNTKSVFFIQILMIKIIHCSCSIGRALLRSPKWIMILKNHNLDDLIQAIDINNGMLTIPENICAVSINYGVA